MTDKEFITKVNLKFPRFGIAETEDIRSIFKELLKLIETKTTILIQQEEVETFNDLDLVYGDSKELNWAAFVKELGYIFYWNGDKWENTYLKEYPNNTVIKNNSYPYSLPFKLS